MQLLFRDDDINPSSDYDAVSRSYTVIKDAFPSAGIIPCVTLFSKYNTRGSVYAEVPFKHRPVEWFYNIDKFMLEYDYIIKENIASHGLFHVNHAKLSRDAQAMSILSSCSFLKTRLFCAPFNAFNDDTINICLENNINLLNKSHQWKSLETDTFDPSHPFWYFHSWRLTPSELKRKIRINAGKND